MYRNVQETDIKCILYQTNPVSHLVIFSEKIIMEGGVDDDNSMAFTISHLPFSCIICKFLFHVWHSGFRETWLSTNCFFFIISESWEWFFGCNLHSSQFQVFFFFLSLKLPTSAKESSLSYFLIFCQNCELNTSADWTLW